ncbi:MAG: DUF1566 domain-containing protein [Rikenellaceae bacterium]
MKIAKAILTATATLIWLAGNSQTYKINATGQTLCYDAEGKVIEAPTKGDPLYGQDASYMRGVTMSFTDNGDGTVSDQNTGLTWQQTPPTEGMTWAQAKEYCENLELGGYTDWRMPTLKELFSISNFEQGWPYLDSQFFALSSEHVSKDEQYWADNKYVGQTVEGRDDAAFGVNHATGHIKAYPAGSKMGRGEEGNGQRPPMPQGADSLQRPPMPQEADSLQHPPMMAQGDRAGRPPMQEGRNQGSTPPPPQGGQGGQRGQGAQGGRPMGNPMAKQVRAVRGAIYGKNNFVDNGDGTISDTATGLMWAKEDNGKGVEWVEALPYAEAATLAGYTDWRLPNVKELQSIVDYSRAPSSKGVEAAIDPIFSCTPFVNEAGDDDFGYYWSGTSACFTKGRPFYFAWYVAFGRAVNGAGADFHGAGAVRFDSKADNDIAVEGGEERYYNFVRLVRDIAIK